MKAFRDDNTDGYDANELAALNEAWERRDHSDYDRQDLAYMREWFLSFYDRHGCPPPPDEGALP